jgi:hypothetical protein
MLACFTLSSLLLACSQRPADGGDGDDGDGIALDRETHCLDGSGAPAPECAVTPAEEVCDLGDGNDCAVVVREEVWADDGESGVCFFLVMENRCDDTLYSISCIEHQAPQDEAPSWQCWWSTTPPGGDIDVSQCHATGNYKHVSTLDGGKLEIYSEKCGY